MSDQSVRDSSARRRELGVALRRAREEAGLKSQSLADRLGCSQSKISRVETGLTQVTEADVVGHLVACGVPAAEVVRLRELARSTEDSYRIQVHGDHSPDELKSLNAHETEASSLIGFEPDLIPGLLQSEEYARALFRWSGLQVDEGIEPLVRARLQRQNLLRNGGPEVIFYLHEHALRTLVGSAAIMHEQMLALLLSTSYPRRTVRIIRAAAGPCGTFGGAFWFMRYPSSPPIVYVQNWSTSLFLDGEPHVKQYRDILRVLDRVADDEGQSRQILSWWAGKYERAEEPRR